MESRLNDVILKINQTYNVLENDKSHNELKILDWIFFLVICCNKRKRKKVVKN